MPAPICGQGAIAERIAARLCTALPRDAVVDERPEAQVDDVVPYGAVVLGSAVYIGRRLDDTRQAAARITADPTRPVSLFPSGPIGDPPKPDQEPAEVSAIAAPGARLDARNWSRTST